MDPSDIAALRKADIALRKATNLEAIVIDLRYNLDQLVDEAVLSSERDTFFTLAVWLDIFALHLDDNTDYWKEAREQTIDKIITNRNRQV